MNFDALWNYGTTEKIAKFIARVKVIPQTGCWQWHGAVDKNGYGYFSADKLRRAHRISYFWVNGVYPPLLDHFVCDNKACVNPFHLKPATVRENTLRSNGPSAINSRKTHCCKGHEFTPENTGKTGRGGRYCRTCNLAARAKTTATRIDVRSKANGWGKCYMCCKWRKMLPSGRCRRCDGESLRNQS